MRLFNRNRRPVLILKAQFQTYVVFSYLQRNNALLIAINAMAETIHS